MTVADHLRIYARRSSEAEAKTEPPCDRIGILRDEDRRLNRQLAVIFAGLIDVPLVSDRIETLLNAADRQEEYLASYRSRLMAQEIGLRVSPLAWEEMIAVLRKWAAEIQEDASEKTVVQFRRAAE